MLKLVQIPLKYRPKKLSVLTLHGAIGETTRNAKKTFYMKIIYNSILKF